MAREREGRGLHSRIAPDAAVSRGELGSRVWHAGEERLHQEPSVKTRAEEECENNGRRHRESRIGEGIGGREAGRIGRAGSKV
jgi:hypothetical protein